MVEMFDLWFKLNESKTTVTEGAPVFDGIVSCYFRQISHPENEIHLNELATFRF